MSFGFELAVDPEFVGGASPTGFAGLMSSKGALRSTAGADFGGGPSNVSGVGVGVGATRRGRDDCACEDIVAKSASAIPNKTKATLGSLGIRFFIDSDSFRFAARFTNSLTQTVGLRNEVIREEAEAVFRCGGQSSGSLTHPSRESPANQKFGEAAGCGGNYTVDKPTLLC